MRNSCIDTLLSLTGYVSSVNNPNVFNDSLMLYVNNFQSYR
jgi:hypothetical protein